ncbi:MAG: hypothetical protein ABIK72_07265 [candidate division WOR-3 bacterium]
MEQQILQKLLEYGGAVAVIVAMTIFVAYLKKNNGISKKVKEIEENHLISIEKRLNRIEEEIGELRERVAKLEVKVNRSSLNKNQNE